MKLLLENLLPEHRTKARLCHNRRAAGCDRACWFSSILVRRNRLQSQVTGKEHRRSCLFSISARLKIREYFSDGITEQIINSLAHVHGLFVVARTTAFSFKNKNMDIREVGRKLGVSHVLEGSVSHGPGKVRVVAQLIDVTNGYHLWSETYDSTEKDLLSLQSDVATKVASALQIELQLAETTQLAKSSRRIRRHMICICADVTC